MQPWNLSKTSFNEVQPAQEHPAASRQLRGELALWTDHHRSAAGAARTPDTHCLSAGGTRLRDALLAGARSLAMRAHGHTHTHTHAHTHTHTLPRKRRLLLILLFSRPEAHSNIYKTQKRIVTAMCGGWEYVEGACRANATPRSYRGAHVVLM